MANSNLLSCLAQLEEKFDVLIEQDDEDDGVTSTEGTKVLVAILQAACSLVRDADQASPDFTTIVDGVDRLINRAVNYAYNDGELCDFIPSYAHSEAYPLLDDTIEERGGERVISHYERDMLKSLLAFMTKNAGNSFDVKAAAGLPMLRSGEPWSKSRKPHPLTSRLSRFRSDTTTSATSDDILANTIYQARCEITSQSMFAPIGLTISSNGTVLLAHGMGGWKNRSPALCYFLLEDQDDFPDSHSVQSNLSGIAYWTTTDEERKLLFAADSDRIKSYSWGSPPSGKNYRRGLPTHTMDSGDCEGPLAILTGGRLVRAGKGSVAVWNLDALPTHGAKGKTIIGNEIDVEDTWRDDPEDIETSSGCPAETTIKLVELSDLAAAVWHPHPSIVGNMIIASDARVTSSYSCISVDLEHGGKTAMKYLGHGASVDAIVTSSPADPNVFMTGCDDGFARLFDVRHSLPVLTLKSGNPDGGCPDVVLIHPDGIPTAFTGSDHNESIKLWDLRAQRIVYELSTGNNAVAGLAWDAAHNSLYAITECRYMDRHGGNHDYRKARIASRQGEDEDEDDDDDDDERCWPERAYHGEDFFGYMFDAGDHRIYRYAFKENPDTGILPCYGQATTRSGSYW